MTSHTGRLHSTYRLQFHKGFTFSDLEQIQGYLEQLGIGAVYASPVFKAVPGSMHGYDVLDPGQVNPELGTGKQLKDVITQLKHRGISWVQDIVPNHMGFHPENAWLPDLLEKGDRSVYAPYFDTGLYNRFFSDRIMVPFLGAPLGEVVEKGELKVAYSKQRLVFTYYDHEWPLHPPSYLDILLSCTGGAEEGTGGAQAETDETETSTKYGEAGTDGAKAGTNGAQTETGGAQSETNGANEGFRQLIGQVARTQQVSDPSAYARQWDDFRIQLAAVLGTPGGKRLFSTCLDEINSNQKLLKQIADKQAYRLCHWRETDKRINYRRFFTINGLICLNMQETQVFSQYHKLIGAMLEEGLFSGLRVDHVDGLSDPCGYLDQLRELAGDTSWIVVEKILEKDEKLPAGWPVQGTSGYDFLALINNLFTRSSNQEAFSRFYQELTGAGRDVLAPAAEVQAQATEKHAHKELVPGEQIRQAKAAEVQKVQAGKAQTADMQEQALTVQRQAREKKATILLEHMQGELDHLCAILHTLVEPGDVRENELKQAVAAFLIYCPVYRYYGHRFPLEEREAEAMRNILYHARREQPTLTTGLDLLEETLLERPRQRDQVYNSRALFFYRRCMQFTGPLMAKGVEDTLMYTYNRFIGHNEVGDSPARFGISPEAFHEVMEERMQIWPQALNTTATHDTKRGEDVRARLNVLSCLPREWINSVRRWRQMNKDLKQGGAPDANEEYFIYQTLAGAWPPAEQDEAEFGKRLSEYLVKALREARRHSNWSEPDKDYEQAVTAFASALLDKTRPFRKHFLEFFETIRDPGRINSLAQVLLKFTCPGVPDIYQGCELWDLSLVDPDNRRPVNFKQREEWLNELNANTKGPASLLRELWEDRTTARIKLWLTHSLLQERKQQPHAFLQGHYIPLTVKGSYREYLLAFARWHSETWYITVIPLHLAELGRLQEKEVTAIDWKNTRLLLPAEAPAEWEHLLDGTSGSASLAEPDDAAGCAASGVTGSAAREPRSRPPGGEASGAAGSSTRGVTGENEEQSIRIKDIFSVLPLALLKLKAPSNGRSAGILMHITSLPSRFGTGDLGEGAKKFARFLSQSGQRYWQLLPLNPVAPEHAYSPYSPVSAMAGNPLLLSPDQLAAAGWLTQADLKQHSLPDSKEATMASAFRNREQLLEKAWGNFREKPRPSQEKQFSDFCTREIEWIDDFALYMVLKKEQEGRPWYQWPREYRLRDKKALKELAGKQKDALEKEKWLQFIFSCQWQALREYCAALGIQLFGDLPFYISYDSSDVWSHPDIFSLDERGEMTAVAGVPPDYFNSRGQLWGMPVFRWNVLKARKYDWWVQRIRKNMEWYDLLRLDHFRAFSAYWEVPARENTAINGRWKPGPGADLFHALRRELGTLSFVAEDLGDIDEDVYRLRDQFGLPGMKVLQFAFGNDMAHSPHIPHQYTPEFIVYTGTHDNNTTRGWYEHELDKDGRRQLKDYTGIHVSTKNVHRVLSRLAYASVARTAILPLQDVLGLDNRARMNVPATIKGNWQWRMQPGQLTSRIARQLLKLTKRYGRG